MAGFFFFNPQTPYFFLPPPTEYEGLVTFNFAAGSQAGDEITLPFTFTSPSLTAVPEPASWVMAITAVVSGLGAAGDSSWPRDHLEK